MIYLVVDNELISGDLLHCLTMMRHLQVATNVLLETIRDTLDAAYYTSGGNLTVGDLSKIVRCIMVARLNHIVDDSTNSSSRPSKSWSHDDNNITRNTLDVFTSPLLLYLSDKD